MAKKAKSTWGKTISIIRQDDETGAFIARVDNGKVRVGELGLWASESYGEAYGDLANKALTLTADEFAAAVDNLY